jgi:hypothetical protein
MADAAEELADLYATLAEVTDPATRASLRARIAALTAACASASPPVAASGMSGVLSRETPRKTRRVDPERGWHEVGPIAAADVLGLKP